MSLIAIAQVVEPSGNLPAAAGALMVYGLIAGGLVALAARARWRSRQLTRLAVEAEVHEAAARATVAPRRGLAVLAGRWVPESPDASPPVRVAITQTGRELRSRSGTVQTHWIESSRVVEARPFVLRDHRGFDVRIEPDARVQLADGLDAVERRAPAVRVRIAQLTADEDVTLIGLFEPAADSADRGAYRSAAAQSVLRAPRRGPMIIATQPLSPPMHTEARYHARWSIAACVMLVVAMALMLPYHLRVMAGRGVTVTIAGHTHWVTRNKNVSTPHFGLRARLDRGSGSTCEFSDEVYYRDWTVVADGDELPGIAVADDCGNAQLGRAASPNSVGVVLGTMALAFVWLVYRGMRKVPWYARKRVNDLVVGPMRG